jgi:hypothetical protein
MAHLTELHCACTYMYVLEGGKFGVLRGTRECGVCVLHEPERYPSPLMVPWNEILETLHIMTQEGNEKA